MNLEEQYSKSSAFVIKDTVLVQYLGDVGDVAVPEGVTEIGASAFFSRKNITSVTLPESVVRIGESAFAYCLSLEEIRLPDGVREIGAYAFSNCRSLKEIVLPYGVTHIKDATFGNCTALEGVELPDTLTNVDDLAFFGCRSMRRILLPASVGSIGEAAFGDCESLAQLTFPEGVTRLSSRVLAGCRSLVSVGLPRTLTEIGNAAFSACYALKTLDLPNGVTSVGDAAFSYCTELARLTLPRTIQTLGGNCLEGVEPPIAVCIEDPALFCMLSSSGKSLAVESFLSRYDEQTVTEEECKIYGAFIKKQRRGLMRMLGESLLLYRFLTDRRLIKLSETDALMESTSSIEIKTVLLEYKNRELTPEMILKMERAEARRIERLLSGVPRTVAEWKREFKLCKLPDGSYFVERYIGSEPVAEVPARIGRSGVSTVGIGAFSDCAHVTGVIIEDGVKSIQGSAFAGCKSLERIAIPRSVSYIGEFAFDGCERLTASVPAGSYAARRLKEDDFSVATVEE